MDIESINDRITALEQHQQTTQQLNDQQSELIASLIQKNTELSVDKKNAESEATFSQRLMAVLAFTVILAGFSIDPGATRLSKDGAEVGLREVPSWAAIAYVLAIAVVVLNQEQTDRGVALLVGIRGAVRGKE